MQSKLIKLASSFVLVFLAGFIGSFFTFDAISGWYANLIKPEFNPPNWIFGPVWTALYILMAIALFIVWQANHERSKRAVIVFIIHLGLNALWSILFFGLQSPAWAFAEIILLWLFIVVLVIWFWRINKWAGILLLPYLLWVSFAGVLNFYIMMLNRFAVIV